MSTGAGAVKAKSTPGKRTYRSGLREQQAAATRRSIIHAARDLFVKNGWTATGMREVAAAAGVALETVYSHFSSKRGLLKAVVDTAARGDDVNAPLAELDGFRAIGQGGRAARLRSAARFLTAVHARTASVAVLLRQAAPADEEVAEMLRTTRANQRIDTAKAVELIIGRTPTQAECDGVWAIASPEIYLLLVDESGWTAEQFEAWITNILDSVVPRR